MPTPVGIGTSEPMRLSIRLRGSERGRNRDSERDPDADDPDADDERYPNEAFAIGRDRRSPASKAALAYGGAANIVRKDAEVVISRSAAMLTGDLDSVLRRAGQSVHQMAGTLLGIDPRRTTGLVRSFQVAALGWVRDALPRYRSYAVNHDRLPIGVSFEDVRLSLEADDGRLALNVGGVEFRNSFDFRASGVVFDIRGSAAVREAAPGFFVDTGENGAATAAAIVETVRSEMPSFGITEDTEGVCVLIRAEASDFVTGRSATWVVDMDLHVPFDPGWTGGSAP